MTEEDRKAAFLILQLAEQGRFQEVLAQMIASYEIAADVSFQDMCQLFSEVFGRIVELNDMQGQIWPGLLPGPIRSNDGSDNWDYELIHGDHIDTTRLHHVIDLIGEDTTDEERLDKVQAYFEFERLITPNPKIDKVDMYSFMVSIIINPDVRHDEKHDLIGEVETIAAESELNLAAYVVRRIEMFDQIGRWPAEELAAKITHVESDTNFVMTWDQAKGIQALEDAENRLGGSIANWDELYQGISEDMERIGQRFAHSR